MKAKDGEPCSSCELERLDLAVSSSRAGELIRAALDLDFAKQSGIALSAEDVSCEDFKVLRIIQFERDRYLQQQRERMERDREAAERRAGR